MEIQKQWNDKLLFVFKKAKDLRTWIANEKSRHTLDHESKLTEAKEKGDELSEEEIKLSSLYTTYDGICREMKKKAKFLLEMRPYCRMFMEGISDEETTTFSMSVQVSALKSLERQVSEESHKKQQSTTLDQWKLAFDTWKTINNFEAHKLQKKQEKSSLEV